MGSQRDTRSAQRRAVTSQGYLLALGGTLVFRLFPFPSGGLKNSDKRPLQQGRAEAEPVEQGVPQTAHCWESRSVGHSQATPPF